MKESRGAKRVAVIGAGPMGLACAYRLLQAGHKVTIYEADDRIGGMSASFDFDGLSIERYYHFICAPDQPLFDMLDELGISDKLRWQETRMGFYFQGQLYEWGRPDCLLRFPGLDILSKLRYAAHVMYAKSINDWSALDRVEATQWLKKWLGEKGYDVLWRSLFERKFFEYSESLSAAWLGTRIKRVAKSRKNIFQERLGYLEGGSETFLEAIEDRVRGLGAEIRLRAPISKVVTEGGRVQAVETPAGVDPVDVVASTVPIQYVPRIAPDLTEDEKRRIEAIENIAVACVILKLDRPISPYFWVNINDESIEVPGIIEYTNLNPGDQSIVYVPYYMPKTHPKYHRGDQAYFDEVHQYLARINPDFSSQWVSSQRVSRYEFAQTVCTPNFFERLPPMTTSIHGLYMADTSYYYPEDRSISESIAVGQRLADVI